MKTVHSSITWLVFVGLIGPLMIGGGEALADFTFGRPQNLGPAVNSASADGTVSVSANGLELYLASDRASGLGAQDLWVCTRQSITDPWGPPANLGGPVNSPYYEIYPSISPDGLMLYFSDYFAAPDRPGGVGGHDLWMAKRTSPSGSWGTPVNLGTPVNATAGEVGLSVSHDGLMLIFGSNRGGGGMNYDLYMSERAPAQDQWDPPVSLGNAVNSGVVDGEPGLSGDGLALFFTSNRAGGFGGYDLWMTSRKNRDDPWGQAVNLGPAVNTSADDAGPSVSPDMRTLYFGSTRSGGLGSVDIWHTPIVPLVDFDGDGRVAIQDLLRLIGSWRKDDTSVDMGPAPWGDGMVDAADLEVLMSYWGQEVNDPTLVAHWPLDETSGAIVHDSAGTSNGIMLGNLLWRPEAGVVGGALELGTMSACVISNAIVSPSKGPFSVFLWAKGGAPGQVIVSQAGGVNWLVADASTGALATELREPGRSGKPLVSPAVLTDGVWHRIGLVWDGSTRMLYMDDELVAEDKQTGVIDSLKGLNLGCGSTLAPTSFWSGMVDEVRVYSRAVKPTIK